MLVLHKEMGNSHRKGSQRGVRFFPETLLKLQGRKMDFFMNYAKKKRAFLQKIKDFTLEITIF